MRKDLHVSFNLISVLSYTEYEKSLSIHHRLNQKYYRSSPISFHYFKNIVAILGYYDLLGSKKGVGIKAKRSSISLASIARALDSTSHLKNIDNSPAGKIAKKIADIYEFTDIYPPEEKLYDSLEKRRQKNISAKSKTS